MEDLFFVYLGCVGLLMMVFFAGTVYGFYIHKREVDRRINNIMFAFQQDLQENSIQISIERHNDTIFVYDKTTKQFMAQGKNAKELEDQLMAKYPGKKFAATTEEIIKSGLRNG
jgi:hypothetical protein